MKIKYVGPRPEISEHGVTFKTVKEDKYVYLSIAVHMLIMLDKNIQEHKTFSYTSKEQNLSDDQLLATMLHFEPTLEDSIRQEIKDYEKHLDEELAHIEHREHMNPLNKEILIENFKIMKEYRIQRAINKMYYMHCIQEIIDVIKREHIKEIDTPFGEKYWHILQTIEGHIMGLKSSIQCDLKAERDKDENLIAKLYIGGYPKEIL